MLEGITNKIGFLVILLSACSWVIYVTGFGLRFQQTDVSSHTSAVNSTYFSHWCFSVSGVPFFFLVLFHLMCGNMATAILALTIAPLYLVSVGGVLNSDGQYLYTYYTRTELHMDYKDYMWVEFGGALGSALFCWVTLVMWSCYSHSYYSICKRRQGYTKLT